MGTVVEFFGLCRRNVPDRYEQVLMVIPGEPFQRGKSHGAR